MKALLAFLLAFSISSIVGEAVKADLVLDSIHALAWDRLAEPGGSDLVTFRVVSNQNSPNNNQLNAYSVGLRIVATNGAVGSIVLQNVATPATSPVFASFASQPASKDLGGGLQTVSGDNAAFANVTIPASGLNLFQARFFSPGHDALGLFEIYADHDTTNYFTTTEFDGLKFANVPAAASGQGVLLGSLQVTATPEPTGLIMLVTGSALTWLRVRSRRAKKTTPSKV